MNLLVGKSLQINYLVRITSVRPSYRLFSEQIVVRNDEANSKSITTVIDQSATKFKSGTPVNVTVTKIGYLGASVNFVDHDLKSIITEKELNYYKIKRCKSLQVGDTVQAYVERVLEDGKVHLSLRPGSTNRISEIKKQLMDMLLESSDGKIQIGERNSAKEIAIFLRGESKSDFKLAISALYKERLIIPGDFAITLADEKDVIEKKIAATAASPSTKHNDRPRTKDSNTTLFVGNLYVMIFALILSVSFVDFICFTDRPKPPKRTFLRISMLF